MAIAVHADPTVPAVPTVPTVPAAPTVPAVADSAYPPQTLGPARRHFAFGLASAHHAFMTQKTMPTSATRCFGPGRPAKRYKMSPDAWGHPGLITVGKGRVRYEPLVKGRHTE